ncbi:predicted protein [Nematostella vectensis]|uniref:BHLH domain-containing protein n=3 Tax=Nematostella vectensis TaxID=45351 RepID=A7RIE7_NEMVE|nr:predicted protein [Nematostella vectensis]|eukprot:XP_001640862.1 predicted protein [Nematostella vectensis]
MVFEDKIIRSLHNDIEKQRRDHMKLRFDNLRKATPKLENCEKASKIQILKEAVHLVKILENEGIRLEIEKENEKVKNAALLKKLQRLTSFTEEQ